MAKQPNSAQRIAFEKWYADSHTGAILRRTSKGYDNETTRVAWRSWQRSAQVHKYDALPTLEELCKSLGCVTFQKQESGFDGSWGHTTQSHPNISFMGYRTEKQAYEGFLVNTFDLNSSLAETFMRLLKRKKNENAKSKTVGTEVVEDSEKRTQERKS